MIRMPPLTVSRCCVVERGSLGRKNQIVKFMSKLTEEYPNRMSSSIIIFFKSWTLGFQGVGVATPHSIKRVARSRWIQAAQNSGVWNALQETYVQQWSSIGCFDDDDDDSLKLIRDVRCAT
ncbi:jg8480 [Pararge aegeria aegeria]|uniref:Jg8480 protein n=1 Tax=Pararge aegeria aegeria TaxID=348720 RepID=A0A8S4S3M8_9NEOP|nr:jg8480 [Pararge aegeria aegeria]